MLPAAQSLQLTAQKVQLTPLLEHDVGELPHEILLQGIAHLQLGNAFFAHGGDATTGALGAGYSRGKRFATALPPTRQAARKRAGQP